MDAPSPPPAAPATPASPRPFGGRPGTARVVVGVAGVVAVGVLLSGLGRGGGDAEVVGSTTSSGPTTSAAGSVGASGAAPTVSSPGPSASEFCSVLATAQLLRDRATVGGRGALALKAGTLSCGDGVAQVRTLRMPLDRDGGDLVPKAAGTYGRGKGVVVAVPEDLGRCEALVTFAATSTDVPDPAALRQEVLAVVAAEKLEKAGTKVFPGPASAVVAVTVTSRASACRPQSVSVPEASRADCWRYERRTRTAAGVGCAKEHNAEVFAVGSARYSDYYRYINGPDTGLEPIDRDETWPDWSARTADSFCSDAFDGIGLRAGTRARDVEQVTIYPTTPLPPDTAPALWDGGGQVVCLAVLRGDRTATKRFLAISR